MMQDHAWPLRGSRPLDPWLPGLVGGTEDSKPVKGNSWLRSLSGAGGMGRQIVQALGPGTLSRLGRLA